MSRAEHGRLHQQQSFLLGYRIIKDEGMGQEIRLLQRLRMLRSPSFAVGQVSNKTLEIAVLVAFGNARTLHHASGALLHAAVASHCDVAARAVGSRHQLPSRSSAKRAIFKSHV